MANKNYSLHLALIATCIAAMTAAVAGMRMMTKTPSSSCNGTIGECMEAKKEFEMDSESNMKILESKERVIRYDPIVWDGIPCSKKDNTTKNCKPGILANPDKRGCSAINRCRGGGGGGPPHG